MIKNIFKKTNKKIWKKDQCRLGLIEVTDTFKKNQWEIKIWRKEKPCLEDN